jgi:uncharacterized protein (DUF433 family)
MKNKVIEGTRFFVYQLVSEIAEGRSIFDLASEHDVDPSVFKKALEDLALDLRGSVPVAEASNAESAA